MNISTLTEIRDFHFEKAEELRQTSRRYGLRLRSDYPSPRRCGLSVDQRLELRKHERFVSALDEMISETTRP